MKNNFVKRAIFGILFVAIVSGSILYDLTTYTIIFSLIPALMIREFAGLLNRYRGASVQVPLNMLAAVALFLGMTLPEGQGYLLLMVYTALILYLLIRELYLKHTDPITNWAYTFLCQLYIAVPFGLLSKVALHTGTYTPLLPFAIFALLWLNDTGAYCVGSLVGKHRLFERISPKKSWEGSVGGAVFALATAAGFSWYSDLLPLPQWLGMALVIVVFGTWGDLTESLFKRQLGIKDSGNFLPGHGGILDRFDSSLLAIPAVWIYLIVGMYIRNGW
ncbi:MAG: phosphatidate cytidylyltransferase [Bacteroides sp.]|nr:phosphatidate cytidylyltransferase [Bacteroides sp.]